MWRVLNHEGQSVRPKLRAKMLSAVAGLLAIALTGSIGTAIYLAYNRQRLR